MTTHEQDRITLSEGAERYRETMIFNNDLLKRNYAERYEFNTKMQADKMRHYGSSASSVEAYIARRAKNYDKRYKAYCVRLDALVEPSATRYIANIRAAFGYGEYLE